MVFSTDEKRSLLADATIRVTRPSRLWRNACVLNSSAFLLYNSTLAIGSIQSSLNSDQGLGVTSMAVGSVFNLLGALLSGVVIRLLGCKWTLFWSQLFVGLTVLANFYPHWGTLVPSAIIGGLFNGFVLVGQRVVTSRLGHLHSCGSDERSVFERDGEKNVSEGTSSRSRSQGRFFLFFVASYKLAYVVANLTSSLILGSGTEGTSFAVSQAPDPASLWSNHSQEFVPQCGATYCNEDLKSDFFDVPDRSRIYALIVFCAGTAILSAVLIALFLDDIEKLASAGGKGQTVVDSKELNPPSTFNSIFSTFKSTLSLHRNPRLLLLMPSALSLLAIDSFWMSDFSKAFVTCSLGMEFIGYVLMWAGVSAALASVAFGWMSTRLLRRGPLIVAPLSQIAMAIGLLYWTPAGNSLMALCAFTACWCLSTGVRHTILQALLGIVFKDHLEQAFSNYQMWGFLGSVLVLIWSNWLCMYIKLYLIIAMLVIGVVTYIALEVVLECDRRCLV